MAAGRGRLADGWLARDSYNTRVRGRMAHKIGVNGTQYEPDIRSEVDLCFYDDDDDVERTKGGTVVNGSAYNSVIGSSSPLGARCLVDSRYRCVEDTSSGGLEPGRRSPVEGHQGSEEVPRDEDSGASVSSGSNTPGKVGSASSLEAQGASAVMEHVDPNPYSSDEWEESDLSDTDGDHSDSSDDDDPKSQVDRLIERGTLVYMDGENSNLSSETESSDSSDYDDSDSESDITDVSPLISATASPLGLSPVLPRRTLGTSPLALHDNRDLSFDYHHEHSSNDQGYDSQPHCNGFSNSDDSTDMTLLLKAVVELEKKQHRQVNNRTNNDCNLHQNVYHHDNHLQPTPPITIHPIDASPHHRHLRRTMHHYRRKNMSFTNDEVRRIDRENQILLQKIMSAHSRSKHQSSSNHNSRPVHKPANSTVNRKREDDKIRRENMILLRKIQEAKPSRDVTASRSSRQRTSHGLRPTSSLPTPNGSCGASARTAPGHVNTPTPRKETAL
ncbi:cilia- and flagella-associated protein 97 [Procambarus clarkii]|uniref:cilia- and flagella-associated protein 97 n=1 Tax=Procambarus clarkii TaxID=6728 RepID=UPI001E67735C|nr:cilia- and flagella-associated protein 97-like [Procambarus clarkii]